MLIKTWLQLEIVPESNQDDTQKFEKERETVKEQSGQGSLSIEPNIITQIATAVTEQINQQFNLTALQALLQERGGEQTGRGSADLLPPTAGHSTLDVHQPPAADTALTKSISYDQYDIQKLVSSVPHKFSKRANLLLKNFQERPLDISFKTNGELYIDSESVPNADIFNIFPQLFVRKQKKIVPGLSELATKIASLNWGHLICKGITKGLKRPKNYKLHESTHHTLKEFKNWWYMSP